MSGGGRGLAPCRHRVDAQDVSHQLAPGEEGEPLSNKASSTPALPQPEAPWGAGSPEQRQEGLPSSTSGSSRALSHELSAAGGDAWAARSGPPEAEKAGVGVPGHQVLG